MQHEVLNVLATYLEAPAYQVMAWDRDVVDQFVNNPHLFETFQNSGSHARWDIYRAIRYRGLIAA